MNEELVVDLFVEDRAHEEFISAIVRRIARNENRQIQLRVRAARGGYPRVLNELALYQRMVLRGLAAMSLPDVLVVAADANCQGLAAKRTAIRKRLKKPFKARTVLAVPDPHVERWYLSDRQAFKQVVGIEPPAERRKCERERYKRILAQAVREGGHPAILGGIEFAKELAQSMDFYRAGRAEPGFRQFVSDATSAFKLTEP
jgi:hypothetical protein